MNERRITRSWGDQEATDSAPDHRVLWDTDLSSSRWGSLVRRKTVRMARPQLPSPQPASPHVPSHLPPPSLLLEDASSQSDNDDSEMVQVVPVTERYPSTATALSRAEVSSAVAFPMQPLARPMTSRAGVTVRPLLARSDPNLDPRLIMLADPTSARAEAFRMLRENLIARGLPRVVAVTSAAAHEGKTTCAINLALALSERAGSAVLLVEANFFEPSLAEIFGIDAHTPASPSAAFAELAPFKVVEVTSSLHVAALVSPRGQQAPISEMQRFEAIVDRLWRIGYERVIIDAPTLDGSAAVGQLVRAADGVLISVRAGHTTTGAVRRALKQVVQGKALGAALIE